MFLVEHNKENSFKDLIVEDKYRETLNKQRSLDLIVSDWLTLLNKSNPAPNY